MVLKLQGIPDGKLPLHKKPNVFFLAFHDVYVNRYVSSA